VTSPYNYGIRRQDLDELTDNPRLIRFWEGLQSAINDVATLDGTVDPEAVVKANASRMYVNTVTGKLWVNRAAAYGSLTGWVLAN
jgi:hypothetical protein